MDGVNSTPGVQTLSNVDVVFINTKASSFVKSIKHVSVPPPWGQLASIIAQPQNNGFFLKVFLKKHINNPVHHGKHGVLIEPLSEWISFLDILLIPCPTLLLIAPGVG